MVHGTSLLSCPDADTELYAKVDAVIGLVMPHSALRTGQHRKWRSGWYKQRRGRYAPGIGLNLKVHEPWDLDNVVPDFFPMPASAVFARYAGPREGTPLAPGTVQMWRGNWQDDYASISRKREALHHDDGKFKSPYAELSSNGATIQDRRLFFVETVPHTAKLPTANTTNVKPRQGSQDKVRYDGQLHLLEGVVSNDHLFDVFMGECIAPYVALDPLKAVLPVHRPTMTLPLNHDDCEVRRHEACRLDLMKLHPTMQRRWKVASGMYHEAHKKQTIKDLYSSLNHLNKLTRQLEYLRDAIAGDGTVRVAYTSAGRPTATIIRDNHAILENALYQTSCKSSEEAYFLMAILNSQVFFTFVEPLMPKGQFGAWHFHKHGWKLPIPRYAPSDPLHVRLYKLGKTAEQDCAAIIADFAIKDNAAGRSQSDVGRRLLRNSWQVNNKVAQDIETAVAQLLSDPAQAELAHWQMTRS